MANSEALAVVDAAVALRRTHAHAPARDLLDLVMRGAEGQVLDFSDPTARHGSIAHPAGPFGQIVATALDKGMESSDWIAMTSDRADPQLRRALMDIWRDDVMGQRFVGRYKVTARGLP